MSLGPGSSAILDLKAELLRKRNQAEVKSKTAEKVDAFTVRKTGFRVERREPKVRKPEEDLPPEDDVDEEALRESRRRLEEKALLYDRQAEERWTEETEDTLVDFNQKRRLEQRRAKEEEERRAEDDEDDSGEWTTFVDALGRTRKCLKSDLSHYLREDAKLREGLNGGQPEEPTLPEIPLPSTQSIEEDAAKEERMRRWTQIESENSAKEQLHYRDVLFDEIREHGQAHFEFSRNDTERVHQMKILEKLREDSTSAQRTAQAVKRRREEIMKERMKKVRQRKGLPVEPEPEAAPRPPPPPPPPQPQPSEARVPNSHIRPWDEGKEVHGVPIRLPPARRNYIEERREERPAEFAPPSTYEQAGWRRATDQPDRRPPNVDDFLRNIRKNV